MQVNIKMGFLFCILFPFALSAEFSLLEQKLNRKIDTFLDEREVEGAIIALIGRGSKNMFCQTISKGHLSLKSQIPLNQWSELSIGPITQLFTAGVLAYLVQEEQVKLSDPISKFFSKSHYFPTYGGQEITLGDLATHTSGLPRLSQSPFHFAPFGAQQMFCFLKHFALKHPPGLVYEPSHLNYALLSHILMRVSRRSLPSLVGQVLIAPLHLNDTKFSLSEEQKKRLVVGYKKGAATGQLKNDENTVSCFGINSLYSTAENMLIWLAFNMGKKMTSLNAILPVMQCSYRTYQDFRVGLGWKIRPLRPNVDLFSIEGGVGTGFTSYMGMVPEAGIGVIIVMNQENVAADVLGEQLLTLLDQNMP